MPVLLREKKKCFTLHLKKTFVSLFEVSNTTLKMISLIDKNDLKNHSPFPLC